MSKEEKAKIGVQLNTSRCKDGLCSIISHFGQEGKEYPDMQFIIIESVHHYLSSSAIDEFS